MATGGQEPGEFTDTHQENKDNNESEDWNYAGLEVIDRACLEIYPDQPNPLQAAAVIKMWYETSQTIRSATSSSFHKKLALSVLRKQ